tara:strand:+ start:695 stop:1264 length:570 start_codon:yes stop_codon:yes gene_type:complete
MKLRKCSKCKEEFELISENFHRNKTEVGGFDYRCKPCKLSHYISNKKIYKDRSTLWQITHPERAKEISKKYRQTDKHKTTNKVWKKKEYDEKYNVDMEWTILRNTRIRVHNALKYGFKKGKTLDMLGCSIKEYLIYLEERFDLNMNWDNYGTYWEIDHIYPLSKGGSFHFTNTQPMEVIENRKKSNKII